MTEQPETGGGTAGDAAAEPLSLPRRNTDPLWLQDYFLKTGHDAETRNGTGTFVKRKGRLYLCTCRHILNDLEDPKIVPGAKFPTLALGMGVGFINLSRHTANGLQQLMRAPPPGTSHERTDIAIAPIHPDTFATLVSQKPKTPIDLDNWRAPNWSQVKWGLAHGYPDEHKKNVPGRDRDQVANQLIRVVAEIASTPHKDNRTITLSSALDKPHTWYFSGLSGGPLYVVETLEDQDAKDEELIPVGIVFEGFPSTGRVDDAEARDMAVAYLTDKDLFIRALLLTPEIFDEWLRDCGL